MRLGQRIEHARAVQTYKANVAKLDERMANAEVLHGPGSPDHYAAYCDWAGYAANFHPDGPLPDLRTVSEPWLDTGPEGTTRHQPVPEPEPEQEAG
jgi:hypothetical protein